MRLMLDKVEFPVFTPEEKDIKSNREVMLEILGRAADDSEFMAKLNENPSAALSGYFTLTSEELGALMSGDIRKIESWVGKLDKRHATWLWCRLCQEKW